MLNTDLMIFIFVCALRLFVPLLIPKFPLVGVILSLIIDGVDQTIFQKYTNIDLTLYQSYDKALDIYYLTITYLSIFRNWTNYYAIKMASFLWYYRLVGVLLFELTYTGVGPRWFLFLFPNTFEYFFIFYEIVASFWDPLRLTRKHIIKAAAFIWVFIKLPQEYWIHIAKLDTTDFLKERVFNVPLDAGLGKIIAENIWLPFALGAIGIGIYYIIKYISRRVPPKDWSFKISREAANNNNPAQQSGKLLDKLFSKQLIEKTILVTFITTIFSQILPGLRIHMLYLGMAVALIIGANVIVSQFFYNKGLRIKNAFLEFLSILAINVVIFNIFDFFSSKVNSGRLSLTALFFLYLLSIIVILYDWYKSAYDYRFNTEGIQKPPVS